MFRLATNWKVNNMLKFIKRLLGIKSQPVKVAPRYADNLEGNANYEYWY